MVTLEAVADGDMAVEGRYVTVRDRNGLVVLEGKTAPWPAGPDMRETVRNRPDHMDTCCGWEKGIGVRLKAQGKIYLFKKTAGDLP